MSAARTERLLALALVLLNASRPLTRTELREAVRDYPSGATQVSFERMFERDKDELRSMGIPVEAVEVDSPEGLGYVVADTDAFLPPIEATEDERLALAMAARVWRGANWSHAATTAIRKLELVGNFEANAVSPYVMSFPADSDMLTSLIAAIDHRQPIRFDYRGVGDAVASERLVQPWAVAAAHGSWYLIGFDMDKQAKRTFRLSRISGGVRKRGASGTYEVPSDVDIADLTAARFQDGETVTVTVDGDVAQLSGWPDPDSVDDGKSTVTFPNSRSAVAHVLRSSPAVSVVEPPDIRTEVVSALRQLSVDPVDISAGAFAELRKNVKQQLRHAGETSTVQLGRLLAIIPWLRAHPGATYDMAAARFGSTAARLRHDLTLAVCTEFGSNLITLDIDAWDNSIYVRDSRGIDAPLQLTESEAYSLLVGLNLLTQAVPAEQSVAITSISEKIQEAGGRRLSGHGHVRIAGSDRDDSQVVDVIHRAFADQKAVEMSYVSGTDKATRRIVDPIALFDTQQQSYLHAWCREAEAVRLFRTDRIREIEITDSDLSVPADVEPITSVEPDGAEIVVRVDPSARWWTETVPVRGLVEDEEGVLLIATVAASQEWIIRSVMSMAGLVQVVSPTEVSAAVQDRARESLARYDQ